MPSESISKASRHHAVSPFAVAASLVPALPARLVFGPLMVLGAYYAQTRTFDLVPLLYALPAAGMLM